MILPPGLIPKDGKSHTYCLDCLKETLQSVIMKGQQHYRCSQCHYFGPRALIIDPKVKWWVDKNGAYCHETSGIFMHDNKGRFLFFDRMTYPFGLAVPAGHVDRGELPIVSAQRELKEETGVKLPTSALRFIASGDIPRDMCRRGADMHRWNIFACAIPPSASITVDKREGTLPVWLTLEEALRYRILPTHAVDVVIMHHGKKIEAALQ